jgi:hypothetical protein
LRCHSNALPLSMRGAPSRIRTSEMSVCKTDAFGRLANGAVTEWYATRDSNSDWTRSERVASAVGLVAQLVPAGGIESPTCRLRGGCSTLSYAGLAGRALPGGPCRAFARRAETTFVAPDPDRRRQKNRQTDGRRCRAERVAWMPRLRRRHRPIVDVHDVKQQNSKAHGRLDADHVRTVVQPKGSRHWPANSVVGCSGLVWAISTSRLGGGGTWPCRRLFR